MAVVRRRAHPTLPGKLIDVRFCGQPFGLVIKGVTVSGVGAGSVAALIAKPGDIVEAINGVPTAAASMDKETVKEVREAVGAVRVCQGVRVWVS